jgi:hypothetical protein
VSLTPLTHADVPFRNTRGRVVARLRIVPASSASSIACIDPVEARAHGEAEVQLIESSRYEYAVLTDDPTLRVRCAPIFKRSALCADGEDWGTIETRAHCGLLRIELVRANTGELIALAHVEVRSVKLSYRADYRIMLTDVAERMMGLLYDARAPAQMALRPAWRDEPRHIQQQIEFLRETLAAPGFQAAVRRVMTHPHRQLEAQRESRPIGKPFKFDHRLARQIVMGAPRVPLPKAHRLHARMQSLGVAEPSMPAHVDVFVRRDDLDSLENQFIKFALSTFRDFLARARTLMRAHAGWEVAAERAAQAEHSLNRLLKADFFADVSALRIAPFASPVLQRKPGYREVYQAWLRFQANAALHWPAGDDIFHAGQRNVAALYEYWLFFQLLDWFCARFDVATPLAQTLLARDGNALICMLRQGVALGPIDGARHGLRAQFSYNRTYSAGDAAGSWTRTLRPDFTFTFWRDGRPDSPTHLHFDAKYRLDKVVDLFAELDDEGTAGAAQREDLLKMHAYRDAIHNTAGAYVLYPGNGEPTLMRRGGGLLPSLGAFAVTPRSDGRVNGMAHVAAFLEEVMMYLNIDATNRRQTRPIAR